MSTKENSSLDRNHDRSGFGPRRLGHANLWVRDVEETNNFYRNVLGLAEVYRRPHIQGIFLSNGNTYHDIAIVDTDGPAGHGRPPGLNHLAFELENEVDLVAGYEVECERGITFTETASHDVAHSVYLSDPDGNGVEIYADVKSDWRELRSGVITTVEPDWKPGSTPPSQASCYPQNPEIFEIAEAVFHPRRTASATIVCENYEDMCRFYTEHIGLSCSIGGPNSPYAVFVGSLNLPCLVLVPAVLGRPAGLHHVSFEVSENPYDAIRRLEERGIELVAYLEDTQRRCVFVKDPSGLVLRFQQQELKPRGSIGPTEFEFLLA